MQVNSLIYQICRMQMSSESNSNNILNKYSRTITEPPSQGASQAMLYATGLTPATINNPQVLMTQLTN